MKIGHLPSGFRCRVSGVSSEKARVSLKPDPWNLCFEKASPRPIMSKKKTCFSMMLRDLVKRKKLIKKSLTLYLRTV